MRRPSTSLVLVGASFYEQLAWFPIIAILRETTGDAATLAFAASAFSAANLVGNLGFGYLSDKINRYAVAAFGLVCMTVTAVLHLAAITPILLIGVRFLHGLSAAAVAPSAFAAVGDRAASTGRGEAMAKVGLTIAAVSMLSPATSGRVAKTFGVTPAVVMIAVILAITAAVALRAALKGEVDRPAPSFQPAAPEQPFNPRLAMTASVVALALMFGQNVLFYALPIKTRELGFDPAFTGALLSAFAVGSIIAFAPPMSRLSDRIGRRLPLLVGLGLSGAGMVWLAVADSGATMALSLLIYGLGFGLVFPAVSAISTDAAPSRQRGWAMGMLTAAFSAGAIVGPLVTQRLDTLISPFMVAGLVAAAGGLAAAGLYRGYARPVEVKA